MGIRFHCQHCQRRLNVKVAQAGQLGVCPHCRMTVEVPHSSTVASRVAASNGKSKSERFATEGNLDESDERSQVLDVDDQVTLDGVVAGEHDQKKKEKAGGGVSTKAAPLVHTPKAEPGEAFMLGRPSPTPGLEGVDPIESAPKKVWFFRTRGFGEKGPIKGREMRKSIDQGEVVAGSKVWREDWDDWVDAEEVFPEIAEQAKTARKKARLERAMKEAGYNSNPGASTVQLTQEQLLLRRQRATIFWIAGVGLAIVFALVLIVMNIVAR